MTHPLLSPGVKRERRDRREGVILSLTCEGGSLLNWIAQINFIGIKVSRLRSLDTEALSNVRFPPVWVS